MTVRIVSRREWGARAPRERHLLRMPSPRLWVHHTAGSEQGAAGMHSIQNFHMDTKRWFDLAYSFVVSPDGTIFEGRGAGVVGGHTAGDNASSHAICLMGNFENVNPTTAAINSLVELARDGWNRGWWKPTLGGHRDAPGASTACPGGNLYIRLAGVRELVTAAQTPAKPKDWFDMATKAELAAIVNKEGMETADFVKRFVESWGITLVNEIIKQVREPLEARIDALERKLGP